MESSFSIATTTENQDTVHDENKEETKGTSSKDSSSIEIGSSPPQLVSPGSAEVLSKGHLEKQQEQGAEEQQKLQQERNNGEEHQQQGQEKPLVDEQPPQQHEGTKVAKQPTTATQKATVQRKRQRKRQRKLSRTRSKSRDDKNPKKQKRKTKKTLAEHRRERQRLTRQRERLQGGEVLVSDDEVGGEDEFRIEEVLKERINPDGTKDYLIKWEGYSSAYNSWEPAENVESQPFYEIEKIIAERKHKSKKYREYLVRWKGCSPSEDTWEPVFNLCDSAFEYARKFSKEEAQQRKAVEESEAQLGLHAEGEFQNLNTCSALRLWRARSRVEDVEEATYIVPSRKDICRLNPPLPPPPPPPSPAHTKECELSQNDSTAPNMETKKEVQQDGTTDLFELLPSTNDCWKWTDEEQIEYLEVQRIYVQDVECRRRVTEARINGTPIVLVGHRGWAQFATRWFKKPGIVHERDPIVEDEEPVDLSQPHQLDIDRMIEDIGMETVPVLKKNYDETQPIQKEVFAKTFLQKCWPQPGFTGLHQNLYLHQWQFPRSESAFSKLCGPGRHTPLPDDILGDDLLKYWLDKKENPFQYIFMGMAETMSKLHCDNGGLEISIAPIVGEKECVLVHRDDGEKCLYELDAKLDHIDLDKYPMMRFTRVWKTVVRPGEILWMPQGTYHQCANVTDCLSYSRFHLDTVNLKAFLESMIRGDAPEIEHDEVIWNSTTELIDRVEKFTAIIREEAVRGKNLAHYIVPKEMIETIDTLRLLRHVCREISIQFEHHNRLLKAHNKPLPKNSIFFRKSDDGAVHCWPRMVQDIDMTLHDFQYRHVAVPPKFRARGLRKVVKPSGIVDEGDDIDLEADVTQSTADGSTGLTEEMFEALPQLQPYEEDLVISDSVQLAENDFVIARIDKKRVRGKIIKIVDQMKAQFVSYEDLPSFYDEYQPIESIQEQNDSTSEPEEETSPSDVGDAGSSEKQGVRTNRTVLCPVGIAGENHRATVKRSKCATFYLVELMLGNASRKRWLCRDSIFGRMDSVGDTIVAPAASAGESKLAESKTESLTTTINASNVTATATKMDATNTETTDIKDPSVNSIGIAVEGQEK